MQFKSDKEKEIISGLINRGVIPSCGNFIISEKIIEEYYKTYKERYSLTNKENKRSNEKYAKKLAAITLVNLNKSRNAEAFFLKKKKLNTNYGFIYIISNLAFEGYYKIGITNNLQSRLSTYQTYDPLRRYKIEHSTYCKDVRREEKRIIEKFSVDIKNGEWVVAEKAIQIYREINSVL